MFPLSEGTFSLSPSSPFLAGGEEEEEGEEDGGDGDIN
jgi:hypothetical protein